MHIPKALNTYVNYICSISKLNEKYEGLKIVVSHSAMRDLIKEGKTIYDVVKILENGFDAPRKRKIGTIERWMNKGSKTYNVVITKDYNEVMEEECWVLIHFGKFRRKQNEMPQMQ